MDAFERLRKQIEITKQDTGTDLDKIDRTIAEAFSTHAGKEALKILTDLFVDVQLFVPSDPHATTYNLGHADLINYFKDCVKQKGADDV